MSTPQRIIIVRLSALGDVVLAQSAIFALRRYAPKAEITWVIDERFRAVADAVPGIRVIAISKPRGLADYLRVRRLLRAESYDVLLAMQANFRVNLLYAGIRAFRKIGFDARRARDLQQVFVGEMIDRRDEHLLDGFNQFVAKLGVPATRNPAWPARMIAPSEKLWLKEKAVPARYAVVHLGTSKAERCWSAARYAELGNLFANAPEIAPVLTGGNSDLERAAALAFRTAAPRALDLCGQTNLAQLEALLSKAAVLISPDTAAVHLARIANVPVVGLYAVARSELSGPYRQLGYTIDRYTQAVTQIAQQDPKKVDWHFRIHDARAMDLITAEDVWVSVQKALKANAETRK